MVYRTPILKLCEQHGLFSDRACSMATLMQRKKSARTLTPPGEIFLISLCSISLWFFRLQKTSQLGLFLSTRRTSSIFTRPRKLAHIAAAFVNTSAAFPLFPFTVGTLGCHGVPISKRRSKHHVASRISHERIERANDGDDGERHCRL